MYIVINMQTSKSPKQTARVAYLATQKALPPYSHEKSPHKFTQPQLVARLVLKGFFTTDYRGISAILEDSSDLRQVLELKTVPHYTTLQKAAQRLLKKKTMRKLVVPRFNWLLWTVPASNPTMSPVTSCIGRLKQPATTHKALTTRGFLKLVWSVM
jgi:hypothetical protein